MFARHGVPETVTSDNGPQYDSTTFRQFATQYGFHHHTSSPHHPSANGEAERAVRTLKNLLSGAEDPYLSFLAYRATPLANGYSPAELLFGRQIRSCIPTPQRAPTPRFTSLP